MAILPVFKTVVSTGAQELVPAAASFSIELLQDAVSGNQKIFGNLLLNGTSLEVTSGGVRVKDEGITEPMLDSMTAAVADYILAYDSSGRMKWVNPGSVGGGYDDEDAQDAVGAMVANSSNVTLTYVDGTPALTADLVNTAVSANSYGSASAVATFTVDAKGRLTAAATTNITIAASQTTSGTFADGRIAQSNVTQHQAALTILESQITDSTLLARNAGNETISGAWTFSNPVTGAAPTVDAHLTTKLYVDQRISGITARTSARLMHTSAVTIAGSAPLAVDGVNVVAGDIVFLNIAAGSATNGLYRVVTAGSGSNGTWVRWEQFDASAEVVPGLSVWVTEGTANADTEWTLSTDGPITLDTTSLLFPQSGGIVSVISGAGLVRSGNTIAVGTASSSRIVVNTDNIDLATTITAGGPTGSATVVPVITYDAYGRLTAVTTASISIASTGVTDFTEAAQDAVGAMATNSTTVNLTYVDGTPSLTASVNAGSIGTTELANNGVTLAKLAQVATGSLLGRYTASTGNVEVLTIGSGLSYTGGTLTATGSWDAEQTRDTIATALTDSSTIDFSANDGADTITADVINASITNAKLRNSAALSVIGNATNASASPADIVAGSDGYVLLRSGTSLAFAQVGAAGLQSDAVIEAKLDMLNSPTDKFLAAYDSSGRMRWTSPFETGDQTKTYVASEALAAGDVVHIWNDAGTPKARKANATDMTKPAEGFVQAAVASSGTATVYLRGRITGKSGLTVGALYYLSTTGGAVSLTPATTSGNCWQEVGIALSATELEFNPETPAKWN